MTANRVKGRPIAKPDADDRIKAEEAVKLRVAGMQYGAIAERLGYRDESGPRKAVDKLLTRVDYEQVAELRQIEGRRLDQLQQAHWVAALQGNINSARIVLGVIDRRMKLFGLVAPVRVQVGPEMTDVEFANTLSELIDSLGIDGLAEAMAALPRNRGYGHEVVDAEVVADAVVPPSAITGAGELVSPPSGPPGPADGHPLRPVPAVVGAVNVDPAPTRRWSNI